MRLITGFQWKNSSKKKNSSANIPVTKWFKYCEIMQYLPSIAQTQTSIPVAIEKPETGSKELYNYNFKKKWITSAGPKLISYADKPIYSRFFKQKHLHVFICYTLEEKELWNWLYQKKNRSQNICNYHWDYSFRDRLNMNREKKEQEDCRKRQR